MSDEKTNMEQFSVEGKKNYRHQAIFFLNAFWTECKDDAEKIWDFMRRFQRLDTKGEDGCELDEFYAHKFLENLGETMTALEMRNALRTIDVNNDNQMCLLEYLIYRFHQAVDELMARPQGINEEVEKAQAALEAVQAEINTIEKQKSELEARVNLGGVKGNTAKQELFKLLNNDPTELNRKILTAEAALRKAQKSEGTIPQGQVWMLNRELEEAKKYKPKGGVKPIA